MEFEQFEWSKMTRPDGEWLQQLKQDWIQDEALEKLHTQQKNSSAQIGCTTCT
jgi:hypothetical protein